MTQNQGHFCHQDGRIQKIEEAVEQMAEQVSETNSKLSRIEEKLVIVLGRMEEHHETLFGGKTSTGLMAWKEKADETLNELKVALKGYGKEPGLIAVIENLSTKISEWEDTRKWLIRLVLGYIVTVVLGLIVIAGK